MSIDLYLLFFTSLHLFCFRCEFDRLQNIFVYTDNFSRAEGLFYLRYLYNVIRKLIYSNKQDDVPLDNLVYNALNRLVRNFRRNHQIDKKIFSKFSPNKLDKIEQV